MKRKSRQPASRWTPGLKKLKAISIRQPWAWLVVNGYKDIENRTWFTKLRGPVLIHAGANTEDLQPEVKKYIERKLKVTHLPDAFQIGGIIGIVTTADCVERHHSRWFNGLFGWVLADARRLPFKVCKGQLNFFKPDV